MRSGLIVAPLEELLEKPRYFPIHVDFAHDRLVLLETTRKRLAATPFLDGRAEFADGDAISVSLSDALASGWHAPAEPDRFIFHVAFCGSTLLSTLLDVPGRSFAAREPQVLVGLANAKGRISNARLRPTLELVSGLLRRQWRAGERSLCKPSNWANNLLPELSASTHPKRALFITNDPRDYLHALFRGGRERMEYVIRCTHHLLQGLPDRDMLWQQACAEVSSGVETAARLALIALHLQLHLFDAALRSGASGDAEMVSLDDIEADPLGACLVAAEVLELDIPRAQLEAAVAARLGSYAKSPGREFSPEARRAENAQVEVAYGAIIDRVLDWAALTGLKNRFSYEERDSALARPAFPLLLCA